MTQIEFEWGEEIATDRKRPAWLRADDVFRHRTLSSPGFTTIKPPYSWFDDSFQWSCISRIVLLAAHPYYKATSQGFTYWPGGENAPDDWDGDDVLLRGGHLCDWDAVTWWGAPDGLANARIIGYRKTVGPKIADLIDARHLAAPEPLPARWAEKRMLEECGGCIEGPNPVATAFARYIQQHEKPPVDPDVLAVREILAAYTLHFDESYVTEDIYKAGEGDGQTWFQAVLEVYRAIKANGGVVE